MDMAVSLIVRLLADICDGPAPEAGLQGPVRFVVA